MLTTICTFVHSCRCHGRGGSREIDFDSPWSQVEDGARSSKIDSECRMPIVCSTLSLLDTALITLEQKVESWKLTNESRHLTVSKNVSSQLYDLLLEHKHQVQSLKRSDVAAGVEHVQICDAGVPLALIAISLFCSCFAVPHVEHSRQFEAYGIVIFVDDCIASLSC
jgi:hypothetical protein